MTTPFHLTNKNILVTGASSGIGRQVAISASQMGANVIITGRNEERLLETFHQLSGNKNMQLIADLLLEKEINKLVEQLPQLDGIVHCSGFVKPFPIKFLTADKIAETFEVNYNAQVILMAQISRKKKINKHASIVFSSSISANHPHKGGTLYASSKAALESFSKVLALEFSFMGIRSNCTRTVSSMALKTLYASS